MTVGHPITARGVRYSVSPRRRPLQINVFVNLLHDSSYEEYLALTTRFSFLLSRVLVRS